MESITSVYIVCKYLEIYDRKLLDRKFFVFQSLIPSGVTELWKVEHKTISKFLFQDLCFILQLCILLIQIVLLISIEF